MLIRHPEAADTLSRALAIPRKRDYKRKMAYLEKSEAQALLASINATSWTAQRNLLMFHLALETGLRVSELTGLTRKSLVLGEQPYLLVEGKGRKERSVPITRALANKVLRWITANETDSLYIFSTRAKTRMSSDAVQFALKKAVASAMKCCPSLKQKRISVHTLRHTAAMQLLERGVDVYIIALWLGHESVETTRLYLSESMRLKRKALGRFRVTAPEQKKISRSSQLSFLDDL